MTKFPQVCALLPDDSENIKNDHINTKMYDFFLI